LLEDAEQRTVNRLAAEREKQKKDAKKEKKALPTRVLGPT
jgi:hypothetical protein